LLRILYYIAAIPLMFTAIINTNALADPVVEWNTFCGSVDDDYGQSVATDDSGNVYVVGESETTWGTPIRPFTYLDIAVAKFDANGVLQWNTFLGTPISQDVNASITTDSSGNILVTGTSHGSWGTPLNPHPGGSQPALFLAKLNSSGVLLWHTFIGVFTRNIYPYNTIGVDDSGNIYLTGFCYDYDWGVPPINPFAGVADIFVVKLDSSGAMLWHTFLGSSEAEAYPSLTLDAAGNVYVTGSGYEWGTPINPPPIPGGGGFFVAKLNANGILQWNTFLDNCVLRSITTDSSDGIFVAGSGGPNWGVPINPYSGGSDGFVVKLNSSGVYQWHTYMGSSSGTLDDDIWSITVDGSDNIYVTGDSNATWGVPINPYSGTTDGFVAKLDANGVLQWSTFFGVPSEDGSRSIIADDSGNVYVTGHSLGSWGTPVNPWTGYRDIVVVKIYDTDFDDTDPPTVNSTSPLDAAIDVAVDATISATFSEDMDDLTIDTNTFGLDNGVTGSVSYDINSKTATFTPSTYLDYDTTYTATITTGAEDLAGNPIQSDYDWSFTTAAAPDTTPPTVDSTNPAANATGVAAGSNITVTFSESMDASTLTGTTFIVNNGSSNIAGTVTCNAATATFNPASDLDQGMTYSATITTGVKDLSANPLQADYSWSFTVQAAQTGDMEEEPIGPLKCFISSVGNEFHTAQIMALTLAFGLLLMANWKSGNKIKKFLKLVNDYFFRIVM